jgi:S1-C subfamily serine protease
MFRFNSVLGLVVAFAATAQAAKYWDWSPDAPHHRALVRVSVERGRGTGVVVRSVRGQCAILTSHHIVGDSRVAGISWPASQDYYATSAVGRTAGRDRGGDLALIYQQTPGWTPEAIDIAETAPKPGDRLEVCGWGPDRTGLRHYWVTATSEADDSSGQYADGRALPGDSGGAILNEQHQLVGILSGGQSTRMLGQTTLGTPVVAHFPIRATNLTCIRGLLGRARVPMRIRPPGLGGFPRFCPPGGSCPPGGT